MPCLHQRDGNVKMYATPTESMFSTLNRARGSLDLGTYKWTLLLNQRLKPQLELSCSQEETVEEVNSVSKGGVGSSCEGEWGRTRGGNILCSWSKKKKKKSLKYVYIPLLFISGLLRRYYIFIFQKLISRSPTGQIRDAWKWQWKSSRNPYFIFIWFYLFNIWKYVIILIQEKNYDFVQYITYNK